MSLYDKLTPLVALVPAAALINNKAPFTNTNSNSGITASIVIIVVIILIIWIMLLMSIYKLTDSGLQTVLCFFFGAFYTTLALIYYGFSGHKFVKKA